MNSLARLALIIAVSTLVHSRLWAAVDQGRTIHVPADYSSIQDAITGGDNVILLNNVIVNFSKTALKRIHGDSAAGPNLLWNNATDLDACDLNPDRFLSKDPLLDKDYKPRSGSPCIEAGVASLEYNGERLDLPADSYSGKNPDLGAFESGK